MAEALRAYGRRLANAQHDFARAMALCQQSLALAREVGDQFSIADALNSCGLVADEDGEGDLDQAQAYYEESLALGRALGHPMAVGTALNNLGEVARFLGEYERAVAYYEECLPLWRQAGHRGGISVCLANLGVALLRTGDMARASACFKEGLPLSHELGDSQKGSAITCLSGLAMIASLQGQPQRAARLIGAADALVKTLKWPMNPLDASEHDRNVATVRAHVDEATFEAAWEAGRAMSVEQAMADPSS
jgi:tetratricopeptide (TPR) repeat protein